MFFGPLLLVALVLFLVWVANNGQLFGTNAERTGGPAPAAIHHGSRAAGHAPRTPADILRERYARGEIDRDEFLLKLRDLG